MTDAEIDAALARAEAATEGPWEAEGHYVTANEEWTVCHGDTPADMVFVAAARQDVPALVAEVRRLKAELGNSP